MASTTAREQVKVGRLTVALSNTGKVLFPGDGITKGDLIGYYQATADVMLPYLRDRPVAMARYPDGITGERIFQKNVGRHFPDWTPGSRWPNRGGRLSQVVCTRRPTWSNWPTRRPSSCTRSSAGSGGRAGASPARRTSCTGPTC